MTGMIDLAYTLLLGWVRVLFDLLWRVISGGGAGAPLQWFLKNWKIWFVVIVAAGLVVDWLMWIVRWRPYRLLTGIFRKKRLEEELVAGAAWDDATGYYDTEIPFMDENTESWDNLTPLSEIHPDWADNLAMSDQGEYTEPAAAAISAYDDSVYYTDAYEEPEVPEQTGAYLNEVQDEPAFQHGHAEQGLSGDTAIYMPPESEQLQKEQAAQYGRPGSLMGSLPFQAMQQNTESEPDESDYIYEQSFHDYLREDDPPPPQRFADISDDSSRRRRSLRGSAADIRGYEAAFAPGPASSPPEDTRPARLVQPDPPPYAPSVNDGLRTVTGKPVKRRGIFADTDEEPIAGLPPLKLDNPFISQAEPDAYNPDFSEDA